MDAPERDADPAHDARGDPDEAPPARAPLDAITGTPPSTVPEPPWSIEVPWQLRGMRESIQGMTSQAPAMRAARRQLGWFTLAAVGLVVVVALVVAVL